MEIEAFVQKKKELYSALLNFVDEPDDYQEKFNSLIQVFQNQDILQNREETFNLFHLISKIEENHHRTSNFYDKFDQIFNYIFNENKFTISSSELFQIYKNSKRMLLLLLENKYLIPDESIIKQIYKMRDLMGFSYSLYLYSGIKPYINETQQKDLEKLISMMFKIDIENFVKKCQIGENDSPICSIIRQDSLDEFLSYVKENNFSLKTKIERSIFESNIFLTKIDKKPSLIEYASFYGSMQIIQYLSENDAKLKGKLWYFAVHSNKPEVIQFCEEKNLVTKINNYEEMIKYSRWYIPENRSERTENMRLLRESVICHHNEIFNCLRNIFSSQNSEENYENFIQSYIVDLYDYFFYPDDIVELISRKKDYHGVSVSFLTSSMKKITIPSSVIKIGNDSFHRCSSLVEIEIPSTVTKIGKDAFSECSSLIEIVIPSSVTKIGKRAFKNCLKLKKIELSSSLVSIGANAFEGCSSLDNVEIPLSMTILEESVFYGCSSLSKIEIPPSIVSFGDFCFCKCSSLKEIEIPSMLISIGKNAFDDCKSLSYIIIPSSLACIDDYTFKNCVSLKRVEFELPSYVSGIGQFAFYGSGLEKISIPDSVTEIGKSAFADCPNLKTAAVPSSVTYIGVDAFSLGTKVI